MATRDRQTLPLYSNLKTTGVYVYAEDIRVQSRKAVVHAESEVKNETKKVQTVGYEVELLDRDGKLVKRFSGKEQTVPAGGTAILSAEAEVGRTALLELGIRISVYREDRFGN